jgi:hypothetical protein
LKLIYTFIIFLLCSFTHAAAQVTLSAPTQMVALNQEFAVDLRITTRDSLTALQFTFSWNPAVLAFQRLDTIGGFPPSAESSEFGLSNAASGNLTSLWIDASSRAYRVPTDSFLIFKVIFKAIGGNGTSSPLQFIGVPTKMKASNVNYASLAVTAKDGLIKVGTTAVYSPNTEGVTLGQNYPNPVDNQTVIPIYMKEASDVQLTLTDLIGKIFLIEKYHFEAGRHEIRLNTEGVISKGIFIYNLKTSQGLVSRILIKS